MSLPDDGLITPEIGAWGKEKYRLVKAYATMFSSSMKNKWNCRVYIDLFAGAGRSRIKGTEEVVLASPLLALDIPVKFDKYIFCEQDEQKIKALQVRAGKEYPNVDVCFLNGDANLIAEKIKNSIPKSNQEFKVLSFCFADPYKLDNLSFNTIKILSEKFIDFLVLIPTRMDANRNEIDYLDPNNGKVEKFLGSRSWREDWIKTDEKVGSFGKFIVERFGQSMKELGYKDGGADKTVAIKHNKLNYELYRLALFSRHDLGNKFWNEAKKYSNQQMDLL